MMMKTVRILLSVSSVIGIITIIFVSSRPKVVAIHSKDNLNIIVLDQSKDTLFKDEICGSCIPVLITLDKEVESITIINSSEGRILINDYAIYSLASPFIGFDFYPGEEKEVYIEKSFFR